MQTKKGIPVSPGIAISHAVVLDAEDQPIPRRVVPEKHVPLQLKRFEQAIEASSQDIEKLRAQAEQRLGADLAKIFDVHLGMLHDQSLRDQVVQLIEEECVTAEYAVYHVMREQARVFRDMQNAYLRDRVKDVWDIERRIIGHLIGDQQAELHNLQSEAIVIAHDLTPSQTATMDKSKILAIATDAGGPTSHTAILAHALGIPAVVGLEDITLHIDTGDTLIIDGHRGLAIIEPDAATLMEYRQSKERISELSTTLDELVGLPAETADGEAVELLANIEFPSEITAALEKGATGIGLYRTEFMYLAAKTEPTESEQYEAYAEAIQLLEGRPLTVRTLDLGADKAVLPRPDQPIEFAVERNPFLGCRSIRLCLQNLTLFTRQLRAILRASNEGPIRLMFPLVSNIMELRQAKMILKDVMEDLEDQGVPFNRDIPVGIMVEVPSVALQAKVFAREVDFFSIGTNDLIQYTVAVDRSNERIANLYSGAHPAVISLIREVIRAGRRQGVGVSLCGEMGGEPEFTMLLIGLGLRSISITPPAIPEVKKVIRSVTTEQCQKVARRVGSLESDREILNFLRGEASRVVPEVFDDYSRRA